MASGNAERVGDLVLRDVDHLGQFLVGGLPLVFLFEFGEGLVDLVQGAHLVEREPHDAGLLGQGLEDGLPDPPHRIGDELEAAGLIELLRRLDQAEVALVDQVGQGKALVLVLLGHRHDETQIGPREFLEGLLVTLADALGKFNFFFRSHQLFAADLLEVLVQGRALAVGDGLGNL